VFQIAAHEDIVPIKQLYRYCEIAREILKDEHAVGRVIARPFTGKKGSFVRTASRRDFSLSPTNPTMLDAIKNANNDVYAVGKISDIFANKGITKHFESHSNDEGMQIMKYLADKDFNGICFVNLVDFDMLYGHRQDIDGYAKALSTFSEFIPDFMNQMKEDDILIITADHGCDPGDNSTDHTREYTPLLVYGKNIRPQNLGTRNTFADISATVCEYLGVEFNSSGESFLNQIIK
jgi:phosphopentomutase